MKFFARTTVCVSLALAQLHVVSVAYAQVAPVAPQAAAQSVASALISPSKRALIAKAIQLHRPLFENMTQAIVMQPVQQVEQYARLAAQSVPQEKREQLGKTIEADFSAYVEKVYPAVLELAFKLAPATFEPVLDKNMTEPELKQLIDWLSLPAAKKYQNFTDNTQVALFEKMSTQVEPLTKKAFEDLKEKVNSTLQAATPAPSGKPAQTLLTPVPSGK
jgi:hypothetical protein